MMVYFRLILVVVLVSWVNVIFVDTANAKVNPEDIEAVFGTAVEVRPPSAIVVASKSGLVTLNFTRQSQLKIGSNSSEVEDVGEGDRIVSTAIRNADDELESLRTLVRVANEQPITKHVVGVVTGGSEGEILIQSRTGGVVDVLIPAGIDAPLLGDGITMVARLDRSSGILTAVGFELTSRTVERIQDAKNDALDEAESERLSEIAIDARSKHLSALDDAARAIQRLLESDLADKSTLQQAQSQLEEIQRRFTELYEIYELAARNRGEEQPFLRISGGLVDEITASTFTIVPKSGEGTYPFSVEFKYDLLETTVKLPQIMLDDISSDSSNPLVLSDVSTLIDPGSELDVKYVIEGDKRRAVSIEVKPIRLVEELEAVLEHESRRAFHGLITLVEIDESLADAQGIVIASNDKKALKAAAKVTNQTEITLDGRDALITDLNAGQSVDIQFESVDADSIPDITGSDITLRALAIRSRSSAPVQEDYISGIVDSIDFEEPSVFILPTDGDVIELRAGNQAPIVRDGRSATIEDVQVGDLVVTATRTDSQASEFTSLIVVERKNVKFSGIITGIGLAPKRLHVTSDTGQVFNVLVRDETWLVVDDKRVQFESLTTGMNINNGTYSVTGRDGTFYNVATTVSIASPKVIKASGIITSINVVEGTLTVLSGQSTETKVINLHLPDVPLGENLIKDGREIRSLLKVELGDWVDIVFYVLETGEIQKLSVVSDNFIQARGAVVEVPENKRFIVVDVANGERFDLWVGPDSILKLNGRKIDSLSQLNDLIDNDIDNRETSHAVVTEVLFIRDSLESHLGVIISIQIQVALDSEIYSNATNKRDVLIETMVSGVVEVVDGNRWVVDGQVFRVNEDTKYDGGVPKMGEVVFAVLVSRTLGDYVAKTIIISQSEY